MADADDPVDETVARLRGGSRDGEVVPVAHGVQLLRAVSAAPGLLDVYQLLEGETEDPPPGIERHGERIAVFGYTGSEAAGDIAAELLHAPGGLGSA